VAPIPKHLLVTSASLGPRLPAPAVAAAIARGVEAAGRPHPDLCPLDPARDAPQEIRALLDAVDFDVRMRAARAVVIACESLQERALAGSFTFEIATRARQAGVPAYAVTANNALAPFDARILDLQLILEARTAKALVAAGSKLAELA
jgi:glycerate kinase